MRANVLEFRLKRVAQNATDIHEGYQLKENTEEQTKALLQDLRNSIEELIIQIS